MPADLWGKEFRAQSLASNYPFDDQAELISDTGLQFDAAAIIDASLYPQGVWSSIGLTAVDRGVEATTLWFGDENTARACRAAIDLRAIPDAVTVYDTFNRPVGLLVLNPQTLSVLQTWPIGEHRFAAGTANLLAFVLMPSPEEGVRGIYTDAGELHADHVSFLGDIGVVFAVDAAGEIVVHAVGDPLFRRQSCLSAGDYTTPTFLKSINGIGPDPHGGFVFAAVSAQKGGTILRIDPSGTDTLVLSVAGGQTY